MSPNFLQKMRMLQVEEQILNVSAVVAIIGVLLPWTGGQMLGSDSTTYSGLGFYTSFIGLAVLLLHLTIVLITLIPLTGGPVLIRKQYREVAKLFLSLIATILVLAALSVLTKVTFEFSRMEVRFGIYVALIGSIVVLLYAFLRVQEQRKSQVKELFHHPEDTGSIPVSRKDPELPLKPPPPPPAPPAPEDHRLIPQ
ncbi:MAG: hypothetical protein V1926_04725 [Candidatus Peregrinibacteria bacterium]